MTDLKRHHRMLAWGAAALFFVLAGLAYWRFGAAEQATALSPAVQQRFLRAVADKVAALDSAVDDREAELREVDYYLRTHNVQDEGFNMVGLYAERTHDEVDSLRTTAGHLRRVLSADSLAVTRLLDGYAVMNEDVRREWIRAFYPAYLSLYKDNVKPTDGYGGYRDTTGVYYEGYWWNGMRDEWGFAVAPQQHLRVGEWRADRYLGERVTYRADRIYGIDISKYQHGKGRKKYAIDWSRLRITHLGSKSKKRVSGVVDYPVSFVYIKSTEGSSITNKFFRSDYLNARKHGFHVGAYHFFSIRTSASSQAEFFLKNTLIRRGDFPPVLDVEPTNAQVAAMGGSAELCRRIRTWMEIVERRTGIRPILYVSQNFVNRHLAQASDIKEKYHVWIARYGEYKPDVKLIYWQLSPDGRVRGIHGEVDINVFNGYQEQFGEFLLSLQP